MRRNISISLIIACFVMLSLISANTGCCGKKTEKTNHIRLAVMIVIDQLPAEMVSRLEDRFGKGGFKYLMDNGVWFKDARYPYVTTLTAVGHATLFTGATPTDHGIVGNSWLDPKTGETVRINDPSLLTATTIGDELVLAYDSQSRVFGVSVKDRGAILPAGYLGKAFWFNEEYGDFMTGDYYYKNSSSPTWLTDWNNLKKADQYKNKAWELLRDKSTYIRGNSDDRPEEKPHNEPNHRTGVFPHSLESFQGKEYYNQLCFTPFADELTADFACYILEKEKLGQGKYTDMLIVSLSISDYIGHTFGPESLEYEDNLLHVDATLAKLFKAVDRAVGLNHTLVVLASDHGGDIIPEYRKRLGMPGGRIDPVDAKNTINQALQKKYNTQEDFILGYRSPSIYLNLGLVEKLKLDIAEVEKVAAEATMKVKGIALAITRTDLLRGTVPDTPMANRLKIAFHPRRSGNILVYQDSAWVLYSVHNQDSAMHGSPYSYDNHVPVFFAGPGIHRKIVYRPVSPLDIAVTVALKLGIEAPSAASGTVMTEVLE